MDFPNLQKLVKKGKTTPEILKDRETKVVPCGQPGLLTPAVAWEREQVLKQIDCRCWRPGQQ